MIRPVTLVCSILMTFSLVLLSQPCTAQASKKASPATAKELVGIWVGFDDDDLTFTGLDLRADSTGYCARTSPVDTILHDYGVQVYRIKKWSISGWDLTIDVAPVTANAESVYLKGRARGIASLKLEIGGVKDKWKMGMLLSPESRVEASNQETKHAIDEAK
ncbi:MAG TPA: hypothetical protein VNX88_09555 [Terriglobales bacterium]|jgi:hypothetical protein|nr:hypothetical protein [Terriglobales bacterium]